ncbi:MAG: response regulator [Arenimonas sp.]
MTDIVPTRILIVDDHPVVSSGLAAIISSQDDMQVVGVAASGAEAIAKFRLLLPDLAVVDMSLPDMSGTDLIIALRTDYKDARFVMLTAHTGSSDIDRALRAGAGAYLFKDTEHVELITALRTVARGGRYLPPAVGRKVEHGPVDTTLTARERDVLRWLARGHTNRQISVDLNIGEETVKSHIKNILEKLNANSRSEAVANGLRTGLVRVNDV